MKIGIFSTQRNFKNQLEVDTLFEEFEFYSIQEINELLSMNRGEISLLLIDEAKVEDNQSLLQIRKKFPDIQIILLKSSSGIAHFEAIDDFIFTDALPDEVYARLQSANMRQQHEKNLSDERNFFRQAVKQEEELSALLLEEHVNLKKAFRQILRKNKNLEKANENLEKIARFDMLSGLLNRLSLTYFLDSEIQRSIRLNLKLSGIMLDIDNFKQVNDKYGHTVGDDVIRHAGHFIRSSLRGYDVAGRYGGEEFFIVLPDTDLEQAAIIAERIRQLFEANKVVSGDSSLYVTASFGVAEYREGESREVWIKRTDMAMYRAKQFGKNRVRT